MTKDSKLVKGNNKPIKDQIGITIRLMGRSGSGISYSEWEKKRGEKKEN